MTRRKRLNELSMVAMVFLVAGCSEWVAYDEDFALPGGGGETLEGFEVDRLGHLPLRGLLSSYLTNSSDGEYVLVNYDGINSSAEARYTLEQYLSILATVDPSDLRDGSERLAYWVNGYNAAVIHGVVTKYGGDPTFKVTEAGRPFFDDPVYTFGGERLTLNQVEHGVLRGKLAHVGVTSAPERLKMLFSRWHSEVWDDKRVDPRIHAVVNCAALSCPNLLAQSPYIYEPAQLDQQLQEATRRWLDSAKKGAGPQGISKLFDWYREDFEASHGSVDRFIEAFRSEGLKDVDTSRTLDYDWTLNILGNG